LIMNASRCRNSLNVNEHSDAVDPFRSVSARFRCTVYKQAIRTFRLIEKHVIATVLESQKFQSSEDWRKTVHPNQDDSRASYVIQKSKITLPSTKRVVQLVQVLPSA
jgi:DNA polymerase III delta prime subunit